MNLLQKILIYIVYGGSLCYSNEEWNIFENDFKNRNREEIYIEHIEEFYKINVTVLEWKTLNIGKLCYNIGLVNESHLAIISTKYHAESLNITTKIVGLNSTITDINLYHKRKNGKDLVMVIAYTDQDQDQKFIWYSLHKESLEESWIWSISKKVSCYTVAKIENRAMLLAITTGSDNQSSVDIYEFEIEFRNRWFYQSIPLEEPSTSLSINNQKSYYYISVLQVSLGQIQIYKFSNKHFILFEIIPSLGATQVVSFENGFKSFIVFNGMSSAIYEFKSSAIIKEDIVHANMKDIEFWLAIPVQNYRDETILLAQRKINYTTHSAFDIDVVTYNGNRFEEHEDVFCTLFGEIHNSLRCLTEVNSTLGIIGSSYLSIYEYTGLIVPKINNVSVIFNISLNIRQVEHPKQDKMSSFLDRKKNLESKIKQQQIELDAISQYKSTSADNTDDFPKSLDFIVGIPTATKHNNTKLAQLRKQIEAIKKDIETLQKPNLHISGKFDTIIFNKPVNMQGKIITDKLEATLIDNEDANDLLKDIVRKDLLSSIQGQKSFSNLSVKNINFENVNGIEADDLLTKNQNNIEFDGDLTFENKAEVGNITSGLVNDVHIESKWVDVDRIKGPLYFEQLNTTNFNTKTINSINLNEGAMSSYLDIFSQTKHGFISLPGNVTVRNLNGENFEEFLKKLCVPSHDCHIPKLAIDGVLHVTGDSEIDYLNNLEFPKEYVTLDSNEDQLIVTGVKTFTNKIRGFKVVSENLVNNVNLSKVIVLNRDQDIPGNITFRTLEIFSGIEVEGKIKGKEIEKFLPNVGLEDTNHILANAEFNDLEVHGKIVLENEFNKTSIEDFLNNVIYNNDTNVILTGLKSFPRGFSVRQNLQINSNSINNISIDTFITKDTLQELEIDAVTGAVDFEDIFVNGLFDGENITELNSTLVKTVDDQPIISKLIFLEEIETETLEFEKLNDIKPENELLDGISDSHDNNTTNIEVDELIIEGNIFGDIVGLDLNDLSENYLSYVKNQTVLEPYFINTLLVEKIKGKTINGADFNHVFSYKKFQDNVSRALIFNNLNIDDLNVDGFLKIETINNKNFEELLNNDIWVKLNKHQFNKTLIIDGDAYFNSLEILNLAGVNFTDYLADIIYKNETNVQLKGSLTFEKSPKLNNLLETTYLNDIELRNILRIDAKQDVLGSLLIKGDALVNDDLKINGLINNVDIEKVFNNINITSNLTTIKGDVIFNRLAYINELSIEGNINGKSLEDLYNNFVYINDDIKLQKNITFEDAVYINGNLAIDKYINGVILSDFVSSIVLVTRDTYIEGPVRFTGPVGVLKSLEVQDSLTTKKLHGESLQDHLNNAIFINKGLLKGQYHFQNISIISNLYTKYINDVNMQHIVPLKLPQKIGYLAVGDMQLINNLTVANYVNGLNLEIEKDHTIMTNIEQDIPSDIVFLNNVIIEQRLITPNINNKSTSTIVTTNTDQVLNATYSFNSRDYTDGHLDTNGLINGIDIVAWNNSMIPASSEDFNIIEDQWTISENLSLYGVVEGDGTINGIHMSQLIEDVKQRESKKYDLKRGIIDDYNSLCTDMSYIYNKAQNQIYKFKYFEVLQQIPQTNNIKYVKQFTSRNRHYLLMQEEHNCMTSLYEFRGDLFSHIGNVDTGGIGQAVIVPNKDNVFLVTRANESENLVCRIKFSTVLWKFENEKMELLEVMPDQQLLYESHVPLTFYGLRHGVVTEFKIKEKKTVNNIKAYRKWTINTENGDFFPHGFKTGLAIRNGTTMQYLSRSDPIAEDDFEDDTEAPIVGTVSEEWNSIVPGRDDGYIAVVKVGMKDTRKNLIAIASHLETRVGHRLDLVEIYLDPFKRELFDKIPSYNPSHLTSVEFDNGETLLVFIEDNKVLQIYEYKGIEGFKLRSSVKMSASQLFLMELSSKNEVNLRKVLAVVYNNILTLLEAVMVGSQISSDLKCGQFTE